MINWYLLFLRGHLKLWLSPELKKIKYTACALLRKDHIRVAIVTELKTDLNHV